MMFRPPRSCGGAISDRYSGTACTRRSVTVAVGSAALPLVSPREVLGELQCSDRLGSGAFVRIHTPASCMSLPYCNLSRFLSTARYDRSTHDRTQRSAEPSRQSFLHGVWRAWLAKPTPTPSEMRPTTSIARCTAPAVSTAPMQKATPAISIVARRPRRDVVHDATRLDSSPAMNSEDVNSWSSWLSYCSPKHAQSLSMEVLLFIGCIAMALLQSWLLRRFWFRAGCCDGAASAQPRVAHMMARLAVHAHGAAAVVRLPVHVREEPLLERRHSGDATGNTDVIPAPVAPAPALSSPVRSAG